jgi:hypothetical protein
MEKLNLPSLDNRQRLQSWSRNYYKIFSVGRFSRPRFPPGVLPRVATFLQMQSLKTLSVHI